MKYLVALWAFPQQTKKQTYNIILRDMLPEEVQIFREIAKETIPKNDGSFLVKDLDVEKRTIFCEMLEKYGDSIFKEHIAGIRDIVRFEMYGTYQCKTEEDYNELVKILRTDMDS